jgi:hypothetical protein
MASIGDIGKGTFNALHSMQELTTRERRRLITEMSQVRGLMPLLMKRRNHQKWSREDKALLAQHMKRLSVLSPYLMIMIMPGGFLVLPALAWWLDRRRLRERAPAADV